MPQALDRLIDDFFRARPVELRRTIQLLVEAADDAEARHQQIFGGDRGHRLDVGALQELRKTWPRVRLESGSVARA